MRQVAVLYFAVFFSATIAGGQSDCDSDAPHNCTFDATLSSCSWSFNLTVWNYENSSAVFSTGGSLVQNVPSKKACPTGDDTHCLHIRFLFEKNNTGMKVLIRVKDEDNPNTNQEVWNGTDCGIGVWHTARIPIQSKAKFKIVVQARKFTTAIGRIFIDYINYIKAPCPAYDRSTVPSTVTRTQEERSTMIGSHVSTDASNDVGVVVGVVVAAIGIAVAVVIFILYRRKRLQLWKTCFRNANEKDTTGTLHNRGHNVGKDGKRVVQSVNETPTVSGYNNHAFTASESQLSDDTYYSVIKDTEGSGDYAVSHYSTIQESKSADSKKWPNSSKCTDDDPYEIKAENGHLTSRFAATSYVNANANLKGKTGGNGNTLPPTSNVDHRQAPGDYSLAGGTGGEVTGVYHCLEEDPNNHGEGGDTGLYHYAKDPDMNPEASADAKGVYHILEEDPGFSIENRSDCRGPADGDMGQQNTSAVKVSKGHTENYSTLDLAGKNSGQMENEDASGGVYNHLNAGSDDPYNEVDREKRAEVIDGEYSHIK
ncbi:hypothetical protein V1264_000819 [Littorina saxatilis]|uniref:MAM domain-containing protein n=1 Tax=Littorina saxatilis TaxID=31220 RepID=A0AAN9GN98_9CAEN